MKSQPNLDSADKVFVMGDKKVFIRHPEEFPIELRPQDSHMNPHHSSSLQLVCHSDIPFESGDNITIKIPSIASNLEVLGTIQSCEGTHNGYELGIAFTNIDALMRIRILEQLCYIQRYRKHVHEFEGRELSDQDAALEWIGKYAHLFPVAC
ncbi:PilZ domain-containing protein [uncultured Neptuniibacter sp.]|uniref:PilZ domain-containing protein n=1 Tax=uncultured Neptuniibacter sp. TaxID=502143 RepID=UPI0026274434|nr:PilZ domain-containing protein [uncultured Neptuniibacter sp.]